MQPISKAQLPTNVKNAFEEYKAGKISVTELQQIGKEAGIMIAGWDINNQRDPDYPTGNNKSRNKFTWQTQSKKGKVFQGIWKPAIIVMINKAHAWVLKQWDPDGFVYDDPRMQCLDNNLHDYINENFSHEDRKVDFMSKLADIALFILKEDIYYRARAFHMLNQTPIFILTPQEQLNVDTFKHGIGSITTERDKIL